MNTNTTSHQSRIGRFFSKTSNAWIAAIAAVVAAVLPAVIVHRNEQNRAMDEVAVLRAELIERTREATELKADAKVMAYQVEELKNALAGKGSAGDVLKRERNSSSKQPRGADATQYADAFAVTLIGCTRQAGSVLCEVSFNNHKAPKFIALNARTRAIDGTGREYAASTQAIGQPDGEYAKELPTRIAVHAWLTFQGTPSDVAMLSLLEVGFTVGWTELRVAFSEVAVGS